MRRLLYVVFFLEVGFVLVVVPWSDYWDRNYFLMPGSLAQVIGTSNFVRGGVSGLGLLNIVAGVTDLAGQWLRRGRGRNTPPGPASDA